MPATAATGPAGLIFGAGAGRFTQSVDSGASWVALPQFNGDDNCPGTCSRALRVFFLEASKSAAALRWLQPSEALLRREFPSVVCAQDNGCGQI